MASHAFQLFADYFQFYVQDEQARGIDGDAWSREASERMLAIAPGAIGVGTVRNVMIPVIVEILEAEPAPDFENWDQVTECSLSTASGRLIVAGCADYFPDAARIDIAPGTYHARVSGGGFSSVVKEWEDADDRYRVQLWPGSAIEPRVLKSRAK